MTLLERAKGVICTPNEVKKKIDNLDEEMEMAVACALGEIRQKQALAVLGRKAGSFSNWLGTRCVQALRHGILVRAKK